MRVTNFIFLGLFAWVMPFVCQAAAIQKEDSRVYDNLNRINHVTGAQP